MSICVESSLQTNGHGERQMKGTHQHHLERRFKLSGVAAGWALGEENGEGGESYKQKFSRKYCSFVLREK